MFPFDFQSPSKWRFQCNCLMDTEKFKTFCAFSLLVNGDFNVTVVIHLGHQPGLYFQSPSKWRFQCNRSEKDGRTYINPAFSLLVNGDFNVTDKMSEFDNKYDQLSVS